MSTTLRADDSAAIPPSASGIPAKSGHAVETIGAATKRFASLMCCARVRTPLTAHCRPGNNVSHTAAVELDKSVRVMQRRASEPRGEAHCRANALTGILPKI